MVLHGGELVQGAVPRFLLTITLNSFLLDVLMLPAIGIGAWLGIIIVRQIPEHVYRWFVIVMTLVAATFMLI